MLTASAASRARTFLDIKPSYRSVDAPKLGALPALTPIARYRFMAVSVRKVLFRLVACGETAPVFAVAAARGLHTGSGQAPAQGREDGHVMVAQLLAAEASHQLRPGLSDAKQVAPA